MRKELPSPSRPARSGTSSAICSERLRASLLMASDLGLHRRGLPADLLRELSVAHDLGVVLEGGGDLFFWAAGITSLFSVMRVKLHERAASMMPARHGEAEGQPEGPRGRVDAGGLADPFLLDGRERVVVQLRHQQPQPAARDGQREHQVPAAVHARNERDA